MRLSAVKFVIPVTSAQCSIHWYNHYMYTPDTSICTPTRIYTNTNLSKNISPFFKERTSALTAQTQAQSYWCGEEGRGGEEGGGGECSCYSYNIQMSIWRPTLPQGAWVKKVNSEKRLNTLISPSPVTMAHWCKCSMSDWQSESAGSSPGKCNIISEEDVGMENRSKGHVPSGGCYQNWVQHSIDGATCVKNKLLCHDIAWLACRLELILSPTNSLCWTRVNVAFLIKSLGSRRVGWHRKKLR